MEKLIPWLASKFFAGQRQAPYAFFGHSMGGLVAYELTRYLEQRTGKGPACLFVSGHAPPQLPRRQADIHHLPDADLRQRLTALGGTPKDVLTHPELVTHFLKLMRADLQLCETYLHRPGPPVGCPIVVYGGKQDPLVRHDSLEQWSELTQDTCTVTLFQGDHFFLTAAQGALLNNITRKLLTLTREDTSRNTGGT